MAIESVDNYFKKIDNIKKDEKNDNSNSNTLEHKIDGKSCHIKLVDDKTVEVRIENEDPDKEDKVLLFSKGEIKKLIQDLYIY